MSLSEFDVSFRVFLGMCTMYRHTSKRDIELFVHQVMSMCRSENMQHMVKIVQ